MAAGRSAGVPTLKKLLHVLVALLALALIVYAAVSAGIYWNYLPADLANQLDAPQARYSAYSGIALLAVFCVWRVRQLLVKAFCWSLATCTTLYKKIPSLISPEHPGCAFPLAICVGLGIAGAFLWYTHGKITEWDKLPWTVIASSATAPLLLLLWYWRHIHKQQELAQNDEKIKTDNRRLDNETFIKAADLLQNKDDIIRMSSLASLERLAKINPEFNKPVVDLISSFIRQEAPIIDASAAPSNRKDIPLRVSEAIKTLSSLTAKYYGTKDFAYPDLSETDLHRAKLSHINLSGASLLGSNLSMASLSCASFVKTNMCSANLHRTVLAKSDLSYADLSITHLDEAILNGAKLVCTELVASKLQNTKFDETNLDRAELLLAEVNGADFKQARNLSQAQLDSADGDDTTEIPSELTRPARWLKMAKEETPAAPQPEPQPEAKPEPEQNPDADKED